MTHADNKGKKVIFRLIRATLNTPDNRNSIQKLKSNTSCHVRFSHDQCDRTRTNMLLSANFRDAAYSTFRTWAISQPRDQRLLRISLGNEVPLYFFFWSSYSGKPAKFKEAGSGTCQHTHLYRVPPSVKPTGGTAKQDTHVT